MKKKLIIFKKINKLKINKNIINRIQNKIINKLKINKNIFKMI